MPVPDEPTDEAPRRTDRDARVDLEHHGDREAAAGLVDFAVNVRRPTPAWVRARLRDAVRDIGPYPDPARATAALAERHGVAPESVLVTNGAAEGFALIAAACAAARAVVVHPQFTEPEAALRRVGNRPRRVLLRRDFRLPEAEDPAIADAELIMVGNPTNPTGVLHSAERLRRFAAPGRLLVVDEAFMDAVEGEPESLIGGQQSGILVLRSLTKTWGAGGLRAGYVVGEPVVIARLRALQPPWTVNSLALALMTELPGEVARADAARWRAGVRRRRARLVAGLNRLGVPVIDSQAPFVLARVGPGTHAGLRDAGFTVRRADTFPGLDDSWVRIAVRDEAATAALLAALAAVLAEVAPGGAGAGRAGGGEPSGPSVTMV